jgi:HAE1 family hydrophobic/amphiphilic exporter-1
MSGIVGEFIKPMPILVSVAMMASVFIALFFTLPSLMLMVDLQIPTRVKLLLRIVSALITLGIILAFVPKSALFAPTILVFILLFITIFYLRKALTKEIKAKIRTRTKLRHLAKISNLAFRRGFISLQPLTIRYHETITYVLDSPSRRKKVLLTISIFTIFSYLLFPLGYVKNEFFPKSESDRILMSLELPLGTSNNISEIKARELMPTILDNPAIEFVTAEVGKLSSGGFNLQQAESNNVLFTLFLVDEKKRDSSLELSKELREQFAYYNQGKLSVIDVTGGPPAGSDLDISIRGNNLDVLQDLAGDVEGFLVNLEGTDNIERSIKSGKSKIVFTPKKEEMISEGISESQVGFWLRTYVNGLNVNSVNFEEKEIDTIIRVDNDLITPEDLSIIEIPKEGKRIPITKLGSFRLEPSPNIIPHKDGQRTITITGSAQPGFIPVQLNKELERFADEELDLPEDYTWQVGGSSQESRESNQSILQAMVISAILILTTMVVQLGSFRKALIVMLVIPLAISGVFIVFALTATPLSLPASIGVLSLFGIVIANSLMVVEKVTKNLKIGFSFENALPEAATSRLEPILLTSAAQVIGLIPATLADPIWRGFGGAIIAGLSFSGIIMLFFIPIVYYYFFPELRKSSSKR